MTRAGSSPSPRIPIDRIVDYYDDDYIAHRRKRNWGVLTPLFERAMRKLDVDKTRLVERYAELTPMSEVLDVGCATGTFLAHLRQRFGARVAGVDFKDLSGTASLEDVEFHCGLFYEAPLGDGRFDLVTMWHFLEHDYDRRQPARRAGAETRGRLASKSRGSIARLPLVRRPLAGPRRRSTRSSSTARACGWCGGRVRGNRLPVGRSWRIYLFTGVAFRILKGRGLNLDRAIVPYFLVRRCSPRLLFERRLNLAMQTVVCRRAS